MHILTSYRCGLLLGLVKLAYSTDEECAYHAALSFRKLAPNLTAHPIIIYAGGNSYKDIGYFYYEHFHCYQLKLVCIGFKALFHLMKSPHFNTQKQAASALRDLAANSDYKLKCAEEGGIVAMITLARQLESALQALAMAGLRHLSSNEVLKIPIIEERALRPVLHNAAFNDMDIHLQAAGLLANLSELLANQVVMVEEGSCITLVNLAFSTNEEVQQVRFKKNIVIINCFLSRHIIILKLILSVFF